MTSRAISRKPETIRYAIGDCWLGAILVAATEIGLRAILLGDEPEPLGCDLRTRIPLPDRVEADPGLSDVVDQVAGFVHDPARGLALPLDIRGTMFQCRAWEALRAIPIGSTVTYADLAARIGRPGASRAVAGACAANPLAVVIPCHRVVRGDGSLSGYRWGVDRKAALLRRERGVG